MIFDLDGTLVDTAGEIAESLNATLEALGHPPLPLPEVQALIGRGVRSLVERALAQVGGSPAELEQAIGRFEGRYAEVVGTSASLFPGVLPGLRLLHTAGLGMSVVTNKPRYFAERLLVRLEVEDLFAGVVAGDDGIRRKPHGDMLVEACRRMGSHPGASLMIGDSDNDVLAARAAGCPVWCVPYGYNEGRGPETLRCDRLVASVGEAARILLATNGAG